nr:Protein-tyrosine phosphatase domain containing protein [Haemonchus contortus]
MMANGDDREVQIIFRSSGISCLSGKDDMERCYHAYYRPVTFIFTLGSLGDKSIMSGTPKKVASKRRKKDSEKTVAVAEDTTQTQKGKLKALENKEDSTQNEKKKKVGSRAISTARASKVPVLSPEVERVVEKFVKHATESGIEALRGESREILELRPPPDSYRTFCTMPDRNRFPEIQCIDETRIILEQSEPNMNTYIHASRVKLDRAERVYILTQGPKENSIEDFWRMIFQEQCAGVVMLCNYFEDGMQKCEEYFPTDGGGYKYYGKMFVNNKKVDHLDQHDIYTLEVLPDGCSNSILTRLAHCTTWPDKAVPSSGRMVLRLLKWMQTLDANASVAIVSGAGVGRAGTYIAIDQMCNRLFKGHEASVKEVAMDIRKQRAHAISNELQYFFIYSTVLDYIRVNIFSYENMLNLIKRHEKVANGHWLPIIPTSAPVGPNQGGVVYLSWNFEFRPR